MEAGRKYPDFADTLRRILFFSGMSQSGLAERLEVSRQFIGMFCCGTVLPGARMMGRMLCELNTLGIRREALVDLIRCYLRSVFPEECGELLRELLFDREGPEQIYAACGKLLSRAIRLLTDAPEKLPAAERRRNFLEDLLKASGADCCGLFTSVGRGGCELACETHAAAFPVVREEFGCFGRRYLLCWIHTLTTGKVLELRLDPDRTDVGVRTPRCANPHFVYLAGVKPPGRETEALAVIYFNRRPPEEEVPRTLLSEAAGLLHIYRNRS